LVSFGLIMAIGPQNAFVLRQSIKREHSLLIAGLCFLSDMILIGFGVMGFGRLIADNGPLYYAIGWGGVAFLLWFAYGSAKGVFRSDAMDVDTGPAHTRYTVRKAIAVTLAITWLNPHVYIDTLMLIGGVSLKFDTDTGRTGFLLGGWTASALWFSLLSLLGRQLAPLFARPVTWRILDAIITLIMLGVAAMLALSMAG